MLHSAASDQGLHCLPMFHKKTLGVYGLIKVDGMATEWDSISPNAFNGELKQELHRRLQCTCRSCTRVVPKVLNLAAL